MLYFDHGYALLVGVGADKPFTVRDARSVANALKERTRCAYKPENVRSLLGKEGNLQQVKEGLSWLIECSKADPLATCVFYYSGHGLAEPTASLVLSGCFDADNEPIPERYASEGLPGTELCRYLEQICSQKLLVLLDCCYAEALAADFKDPTEKPAFLERLKEGVGRVVLASSTSYERSAADGFESYFTAALLEGLAGYGSQDRDGYAKVFDITGHIQKTVRMRSRETQHPVFRVSALHENFPIAFYAAGDPLPKPLSPEFPLPPVPTELYSEAERSTFLALKSKKEEARILEDKMATFGPYSEVPKVLKDELAKLEKEMFVFEARLGLVRQQSPFHLQLAEWWSRIGLANFLIGFIGYWANQSSIRSTLFGQTNRASVCVIGLILSGICFALLFAFTHFFQKEVQGGPWYFRLPVAFNFRSIFFDLNFAKSFQIAVVVLFFAAPLAFHVYGFRQIWKQSLYLDLSNDSLGNPIADRDLGIKGPDHWTQYFGFCDSVFGGNYGLGRKDDGHREGITYFPFWATWALTFASIAWLSLYLRLLLGLIFAARADTLRPHLESGNLLARQVGLKRDNNHERSRSRSEVSN